MTLRIRRADACDAELLWQWRNDPVVRANSFNSDPVPWLHHVAWYAKKLSSPDTLIFVLDDGAQSTGQIRYERENESLAKVGGISVSSGKRGKGYGKTILLQTAELACEQLKVEKLVAVVKETNLVSLRAFLAAGFNTDERIIEQGYPCQLLVYCCQHASCQR